MRTSLLIAAATLAFAVAARAQAPREFDEIETVSSAVDDAIDWLRQTWEKDGYEVQAGGRFVFDILRYDPANKADSGARVTDARILLTGGKDGLDWWIEADLIGIDTRRNLYEAWVGYEIDPAFRVRAGQVRVALASGFATREEALPTISYGFGSYLAARYDVGLQADGNLWDDDLWYEANATLGKGFNLEGLRLTSPLLSLRVVGKPFGWIEQEEENLLTGLYVGAGYAWLGDFDDPIDIENPLPSTVFRTGDLDGDSGDWFAVEFGWNAGPFRLGFERVVGSANNVPTGGGKKDDIDQLTGFTWRAAINLTGEPVEYLHGRWVSGVRRAGDPHARVAPVRNRVELAVRFSNADIDRRLFHSGIAIPGQSTQEVRTTVVALNWFLTESVRVSLAWFNTIADEPLIAFGGGRRDSSFLLRLDINF